MKSYTLAVVGATGLVGSTMLKVLAENTDIPVKSLRAMATRRTAGTVIDFRGTPVTVEDVASADFTGIDAALFAGGDIASAEYAPKAVAQGAVVIDNSSTYRQAPDVPLVIPEVNAHALTKDTKLIANPNCSTIQMLSALAPLHRAWGLKSVSVATYQSVSGAGKEAVEELRRQAAAIGRGEAAEESKVFPHRIAFNLFPQIGSFNEDGISGEEYKMVVETRKIMELPDIPVLATCVRVPVFFAHSEAVQAAFEKPCDPEEARRLLAQAPDVKVIDDSAAAVYPTPLDAEDQDLVLVGRIRRDITAPGSNGLAMWVVADNLRKGAATNAVNILKAMIKIWNKA